MATKKSPEVLVAEQAETPIVEAVEAPVAEPGTVEKAEAPVKAPKAVERPGAIRAEDGDNYLTIAERFGLDARELAAFNNEAPVSTGTKVRLP